MNSQKNNFIIKNSKSNCFINKNDNINNKTKIKIPKIDTMYDKVKNHFQSYDFIKLQLLGEDNDAYGDLLFQGYIYKPKKIRVEYLGDNKIKSEFLLNKKCSKKNSFFIKTKNKIKNNSFINPCHNTNKITKIVLDKDNISFNGKKLPIIKRINNSNYYENNKNKNNRNFNSINYENNSGKIKIIKNITQIRNNSKIKNLNRNRNNSSIMNMNKKNFNNNNSTRNLIKKINIYNLKKQLKNKVDLLENKVNNSSKFILKSSKINEEQKP